MKKLLAVSLSLLFALAIVTAAQNTNSSTTSSDTNKRSSGNRKRGPVFRASKEQIKEAQGILKGRSFYTGEGTGKLDAATRASLKEYQKAEGLKITGTLNKSTLEKMGVALTDKQKTM